MLMLSVTKILYVSVYVCHKYLCVLGTKDTNIKNI